MGKNGVVVVRGRQDLAHEPRGVFLPTPHRPVVIRLAATFAGKQAFAVQVIHHGHHRGVRGGALQDSQDVAHGNQLRVVPKDSHDVRLKLTETVRASHPTTCIPGKPTSGPAVLLIY